MNPHYLIFIVSSKLVWLPDPDILQLDKMVSFDVVDRLASLKVNGRKQFRYSQRVAITTGCEMDLTSFPHDKQVVPSLVIFGCPILSTAL